MVAGGGGAQCAALAGVSTGREQQPLLRLREQARRAARIGQPVSGRFVTGAERAAALQEARENGVCASFDGGWADAERMQVCFHPKEQAPCFTAVWVEAAWHTRFGQADHRALLGSLMALGMERSCFGDLVMQEDRAYLCVLPEIAATLPELWQEAGRTALRVCVLHQPPAIRPPQGRPMRDTVACTRLDCVLASGMRLSRSRAAVLIRAGNVQVDHLVEERADRVLQEGALLSVHGFGRIRLCEIGELTRKGRVPVVLEVFSRSSG